MSEELYENESYESDYSDAESEEYSLQDFMSDEESQEDEPSSAEDDFEKIEQEVSEDSDLYGSFDEEEEDIKQRKSLKINPKQKKQFKPGDIIRIPGRIKFIKPVLQTVKRGKRIFREELKETKEGHTIKTGLVLKEGKEDIEMVEPVFQPVQFPLDFFSEKIGEDVGGEELSENEIKEMVKESIAFGIDKLEGKIYEDPILILSSFLPLKNPTEELENISGEEFNNILDEIFPNLEDKVLFAKKVLEIFRSLGTVNTVEDKLSKLKDIKFLVELLKNIYIEYIDNIESSKKVFTGDLDKETKITLFVPMAYNEKKLGKKKAFARYLEYKKAEKKAMKGDDSDLQEMIDELTVERKIKKVQFKRTDPRYVQIGKKGEYIYLRMGKNGQLEPIVKGKKIVELEKSLSKRLGLKRTIKEMDKVQILLNQIGEIDDKLKKLGHKKGDTNITDPRILELLETRQILHNEFIQQPHPYEVRYFEKARISVEDFLNAKIADYPKIVEHIKNMFKDLGEKIKTGREDIIQDIEPKLNIPNPTEAQLAYKRYQDKLFETLNSNICSDIIKEEGKMIEHKELAKKIAEYVNLKYSFLGNDLYANLLLSEQGTTLPDFDSKLLIAFKEKREISNVDLEKFANKYLSETFSTTSYANRIYSERETKKARDEYIYSAMEEEFLLDYEDYETTGEKVQKIMDDLENNYNLSNIDIKKFMDLIRNERFNKYGIQNPEAYLYFSLTRFAKQSVMKIIPESLVWFYEKNKDGEYNLYSIFPKNKVDDFLKKEIKEQFNDGTIYANFKQWLEKAYPKGNYPNDKTLRERIFNHVKPNFPHNLPPSIKMKLDQLIIEIVGSETKIQDYERFPREMTNLTRKEKEIVNVVSEQGRIMKEARAVEKGLTISFKDQIRIDLFSYVESGKYDIYEKFKAFVEVYRENEKENRWENNPLLARFLDKMEKEDKNIPQYKSAKEAEDEWNKFYKNQYEVILKLRKAKSSESKKVAEEMYKTLRNVKTKEIYDPLKAIDVEKFYVPDYIKYIAEYVKLSHEQRAEMMVPLVYVRNRYLGEEEIKKSCMKLMENLSYLSIYPVFMKYYKPDETIIPKSQKNIDKNENSDNSIDPSKLKPLSVYDVNNLIKCLLQLYPRVFEFLYSVIKIYSLLNEKDPIGKNAKMLREKINSKYITMCALAKMNLVQLLPELLTEKDVEISSYEKLRDYFIDITKRDAETYLTLLDPTRRVYFRQGKIVKVPELKYNNPKSICFNRKDLDNTPLSNLIMCKEENEFFCFDREKLLEMIRTDQKIINPYTNKPLPKSLIVTILKTQDNADLKPKGEKIRKEYLAEFPELMKGAVKSPKKTSPKKIIKIKTPPKQAIKLKSLMPATELPSDTKPRGERQKKFTVIKISPKKEKLEKKSVKKVESEKLIFPKVQYPIKEERELFRMTFGGESPSPKKIVPKKSPVSKKYSSSKSVKTKPPVKSWKKATILGEWQKVEPPKSLKIRVDEPKTSHKQGKPKEHKKPIFKQLKFSPTIQETIDTMEKLEKK